MSERISSLLHRPAVLRRLRRGRLRRRLRLWRLRLGLGLGLLLPRRRRRRLGLLLPRLLRFWLLVLRGWWLRFRLLVPRRLCLRRRLGLGLLLPRRTLARRGFLSRCRPCLLTWGRRQLPLRARVLRSCRRRRRRCRLRQLQPGGTTFHWPVRLGGACDRPVLQQPAVQVLALLRHLAHLAHRLLDARALLAGDRLQLH